MKGWNSAVEGKPKQKGLCKYLWIDLHYWFCLSTSFSDMHTPQQLDTHNTLLKFSVQQEVLTQDFILFMHGMVRYWAKKRPHDLNM